MRVTSLHIHPVKSTMPIDLDNAIVEPWGLAGDRRWMVVDPDGAQMTAREWRPLLRVRSRIEDSVLVLEYPGAEPLTVDSANLGGANLGGANLGGAIVSASVWTTTFPATDAGAAAAHWFTALLNEPARLVYLHDPTARPIASKALSRPDDRVNLADGFPLLLTSTASLTQLNDWIAADRPANAPTEPLAMRRFRPNVVIDGETAFAEDRWTRLRIGGVTFRSGGACSRCVMTTVDPFTLAGGKEPIRTLARRHSWDGNTWFGLNLVPEGPGALSVGDKVELLN